MAQGAMSFYRVKLRGQSREESDVTTEELQFSSAKVLNWLWLQGTLYGCKKYKEFPSVAAAVASDSAPAADGTRQLMQLDSTLWQRLPSCLQEAIAARLPICARFRCRIVCKRWSSFPFIFLGNPLATATTMPCLLHLHVEPGGWSFYDPTCSTARWHALPPLLFPNHPSPTLRLRCSEGGLVCLELLDPNSLEFGEGKTATLALVVCNPITGRYRRLEIPGPPPPPQFLKQKRIRLVHLLASSPYSYRLFLVKGDRTTWLYESGTGNWEQLPNSMPLSVLDVESGLGGGRGGGNTYFRSWRGSGDAKIVAMEDKGFWLFEFDMEERLWRVSCRDVAPRMFTKWCSATLLESRGEVFVAGLRYADTLHGSMHVWQLDRKLQEWRLVSTFPGVFYRPDLKAMTFERFDVQGSQDLVMVTCIGSCYMTPAAAATLPIRKTFYIASYDLLLRTWTFLTPLASNSQLQQPAVISPSISLRPHPLATP